MAVRVGRAFIATAAVLALLGGCTRRQPARPPATSPADRAAATTTIVAHVRGGVARVGVWEQPDVGAPTLGGAAVRALVLPQLFVAQPDGRWAASLVEPGTDRLAADRRAASFRLRRGASWSDGRPITADDLRRSADRRFVAGVDGPAADGTITVRLTQPLPGWQRLWSGVDSVAPPAPGVWGGPFVLAGSTPGVDVVLRRNDRWYGGPGPFLDEVRLVLVPDPVTARQLLARGELDVLVPLPSTNRVAQLSASSGVVVTTGPMQSGGWQVALRLNPAKLSPATRQGVVATVDRGLFVGTLLRGEASVVEGLAGSSDRTWATAAPPDVTGLRGAGPVDLVGEVEEPMTPLLQRAMQKRARAAGGTLELRDAEADRVEGWLRDGSYGAAIVAGYDGPAPCWTCTWGSLDPELARSADAGDPTAARSLEARLRDEALELPLWRGVPVVAARSGLHGVVPNAYGLCGAWNAWEWWRG